MAGQFHGCVVFRQAAMIRNLTTFVDRRNSIIRPYLCGDLDLRATIGRFVWGD